MEITYTYSQILVLMLFAWIGMLAGNIIFSALFKPDDFWFEVIGPSINQAGAFICLAIVLLIAFKP